MSEIMQAIADAVALHYHRQLQLVCRVTSPAKVQFMLVRHHKMHLIYALQNIEDLESLLHIKHPCTNCDDEAGASKGQ